MDKRLNVLVLDDAEDDFILITRRLRDACLDAHYQCVANLEDLKAAVAKGDWDVILADYRVPALDFTDTLAFHEAHQPDVPLILVSGNIGEASAVELLKHGVWDFVLKDNLTRLAPVIRSCVRDATNRRARHKAEATLRDNEQRYRMLFEHARDGMALAEAATGILLDCNQALCRLVEREKSELIGRHQGHRADG